MSDNDWIEWPSTGLPVAIWEPPEHVAESVTIRFVAACDCAPPDGKAMTRGAEWRVECRVCGAEWRRG
jgi:hypothetical protein